MDAENERQINKRKQQYDHKDDKINNCFDQLPYEIVTDIFSRLPITSLIQFSFVSQSLNSLLSHDPHLVNMHLSRSSTNGSSCLIFHSDYPIQNQLYFLQLSDKTAVRKIDTPFAKSMPEFSIIGSSNGLLCLINTLFPESIYLYNPFTRSYSELPKNFFNFQDIHGAINVYGFGFHPTTNDYKLIKIAYHKIPFVHPRRDVSEIQIYSLNSNTWKNKGGLPYRLEKSSSPGVLVSGRLHWVSRWGRFEDMAVQWTIVSFDLADDSFHAIKNPGWASGSFERWVGCQLVALDGCLCTAVPVPPGDGALDIWIMKEYGVSESWVKAYSIGAYSPESVINHKMETSSDHIWRNIFDGKYLVRVLCVMESGKLLLEYRRGGLVSYDLQNESFKEMAYQGMPRLYQTIVHVGSLKSVDACLS